MRLRAVIAFIGVAVGGFVAIASNGCGKDDSSSARRSQKGEACQVTNDCADGLACVPVPSSSNGPSTGICVTGQFHIDETARECALIECQAAEDCCPTPPTQCAQYLAQCNDAGPGSSSCQEYDQLCKCDTSRTSCENDHCVNKCSTDVDCFKTNGATPKCGGGKCVQCVSDGDCANGQNCLNGTCQSPCQTDGDCAGFNRCVTGKCVASGCQTDRECVAATRNVEATCGTDGKCIVPCQTDLECGNPKDYSFFSCIRNQCVYTGCQTDKDCRLLYTGTSDASTLQPKQHVVCRDKQAPGDITKPAN